jgi:hypothetical protein
MFVHGTGVRSPAYAAACQLIETKLTQYAPDVELAKCMWGDDFGASLSHDGKSIPTYGETRSFGQFDEDALSALWFLLLQDPMFELRLLVDAHAESLNHVPNEEPPGVLMHHQFAALRLSDPLAQEMIAMGMGNASDILGARKILSEVVDQITSSIPYQKVELCRAAGSPRHREVLARALVASMQKIALEAGLPMLDFKCLETLVKHVESMFGNDTRGILATVLTPFFGLLFNLSTWHARRKRTALTDAAYPAAGDILVYQARGASMRNFIRSHVSNFPNDEVFLLAHSLGGIACFEMLVEAAPSNVGYSGPS